jgi:hypothetical protein
MSLIARSWSYNNFDIPLSLDPNFGTVAGIEALLNELIMNAAQTPGLGECKSTHAFDTRDPCLSEIPF